MTTFSKKWDAQPHSEVVSWRMLDTAYADPATPWSYLILCIILGGLVFSCMRDIWSADWAIFGVGVALFRLVDRQTYPARKKAGPLIVAQRRFMMISVLRGLYWGSSSLVLLLSSNLLLHFWVITAEAAVVSLAVARLSPMATAVKTDMTLSLTPLIICCIVTGNAYYQGYALMALLYLFSMFAVVNDLNRQTVRLLTSEETNAALLRGGAETNARLEEANRRLEAIAATDGLTGIPNRRCFDERMRSAWVHAARAGTSLSFLLIDIDNFKSYNDSFGHMAGDACLRQVAKCLAGAIRPSEFVARFGGEEFAVIANDIDSFGTIDFADRLRAGIGALALPSPSGDSVTVSIGAALCKPAFDSSAADAEPTTFGIDALIAEADANLYEAKRAGRNCVRGARAEIRNRLSAMSTCTD